MANKIDLNILVDRLVKLVGKKEVASILLQFEGEVDGWPNRKQRMEVCKTLCIVHESEIDGG